MTEEELVSLVRFLEETPRVVRQFSENLSETELRWKPSEDEFSVLENVCHLRDIEREGYSVRIEKLLNEDKPLLHDLDRARTALARYYNNLDFSTALEDIFQTLEVNARMLVELSVAQLTRS